MARLFDKIKALVGAERYAIGQHAIERLEERRILEWQIVYGLESAELLRERPRDRPNPAARSLANTAAVHGGATMNVLESSIPLAACLAGLVVSGAAGQIVQISTHQRSVSGFVIVPPCPPSIASDSETAIGQNPFDASVQALKSCAAASAEATAEQTSTMQPGEFIAAGASAAQTSTTVQTVIHDFANSHYQVTINVLQPARYALMADLHAAGGSMFMFSRSQVRLNGANGPVFEHVVNPLPGGVSNQSSVQQSAQLPVGQYTFLARCEQGMDAFIPAGTSAAANSAFDIQFTITLLGDVNGDETVNVDDLLAVINAWGPCPPPKTEPPPCLADLDDNDDVDVDDLLLVINNWS